MLDQTKIDDLRQIKIPEQKLLIGNHWIEACSGKKTDIISPIDGMKLAEMAIADEIDVNNVSKYEEAWNDHSSATISQTLKNIRETGDLTDEDMAEIKKTAIDFNKTFNS